MKRTMKVRMPFLLSISKIASMTLLSRIGGFARDMVLANTFGASLFLDAFLIAFKIPNFMRRIFAEGAFSQAFVPIFSEIQGDKTSANHFVSQSAGGLIVVLTLLTLFVIAFPKVIITLFAFGITDNPYMFDLTANLLRLTMPYLMLIALVTLYGTVNNCYGYFTVTAATPILLNFIMILGAIFSNNLQEPIYGLAYAIPIAGFAQLCTILYFYKGQIDFPSINFQSKKIKILFRSFLIIVGGTIITQLNLIIDTMFLSFLPSGSISWLYYADRLINLPIGIIAVAVATLLLPKLSKAISDKDTALQRSHINWALKLTLCGMLPCVLVIGLLGIPMIITIYLHGSYSLQDALMTHYALIAMNIGLPAIMFNKILMVIFYAHRRLKTPTIIAIMNGIITIVLNIILIPHYQHVALAISLSIANWVQLLLLSLWAYKRQWIKVSVAALLPWSILIMLMTITCYFLSLLDPPMDWWVHAGLFARFELFTCMGILVLSLFWVFLKKFKLLEQILI